MRDTSAEWRRCHTARWSPQLSCRPRPPLIGPALVTDNIAKGALGQRRTAVDVFEVEDALLKVRSEQREVQELGDPGPGEPELAGGFGAVAVVAAPFLVPPFLWWSRLLFGS